MTPDVHEAITAELRYQLPLQARGSHARRNYGKAKRSFLRSLATQTPGIISWFVAAVQRECPDATPDDVAQVAQAVIDRWDAPWLADAEAMQADYRDAAETTAGLLTF